MSREDRDAKPRRLLALAGLLQVYRAGKGWSVEQAAAHAGVGHMTWRRAESGAASRVKTYAQMDGLFGFPLGTTNRATNDDELMLGLARKLGVDTGDMSASEWVRTFARGAVAATPAGRAVTDVREQSGSGTVGLGGLAAHAGHPPPPTPIRSDVAAIADVLERIRAWPPDAQNNEVIKALTDALQRHLIDPRHHNVTATEHPDGSWTVQVEPKDPDE